MISLKQLTYALAVGKTLHFRKAADACAVSPSALSTALAELEKKLGIQIFERNNKKVIVTPLGKQFLEQANQIKLQVDDLYQMSLAQQNPLSTPMSMGLIPTIAPYLLPKVMPQLRALYPDFKLQIIEEQSHVLIDLVRSGDLDTAVLALPFPHDGLLAFEFWSEDFFWVTHCNDEHAGQREISGNELDREKLMLLKDGHCLKDQALAACNFKSTETGNALSSTSLNTLIQMVAGKMGTTLVPGMALDQLISNSSELRAVHLNEPGPHRIIAFIARPNYAGVANIQLLMDLFSKQLRDTCSIS
jgi:LysR family transcriptional regulator, hydrogen peroxide-inducible genes activator